MENPYARIMFKSNHAYSPTTKHLYIVGRPNFDLDLLLSPTRTPIKGKRGLFPNSHHKNGFLSTMLHPSSPFVPVSLANINSHFGKHQPSGGMGRGHNTFDFAAINYTFIYIHMHSYISLCKGHNGRKENQVRFTIS